MGTEDMGVDFSRDFIGDTNGMTVFVSRVPRRSSPSSTNPVEEAQISSDQRLVVYWICDGGGLARQEIAVATGNTNSVPLARGTGNEKDYIIAPEVVRFELSYFDGQEWQPVWDGTEPIPDSQGNNLPKGPPLAVAVVMEIETPGPSGSEPRRRVYRHVIAIPTANGPTQQPSEMPDMSMQQQSTQPSMQP